MKDSVTQRLFVASLGIFALGTFATRATAATDDQSFVQSAYAANAAEIAEARYVLKNSRDAKTRAFAQLIIDDHTTANVALLKAARTSQLSQPSAKVVAAAAAPDAPPPALVGLSGMDLSKAYFTQAVADHRTVLAAVTDEARGASSPTLRQFASDQEPIVRHHLDLASQWVESGGKMPAMISPASTPATGIPATAGPVVDPNGPLQSAAPTVQTTGTANPQPTSSSVVPSPIGTHTPGPP